VLVPARDEERTIGECLAALDASLVRPAEVLVLDDGSTDGTARILSNAGLAELRVLRNETLPPGWVGKVHACHRLASEATGDVLLFLDADTRLAPEGLARIASLFEDYRADVVTAVPRQETRTWSERLLLPLLHLTYAAWLPMPLVWRTSDPRLLAANGQVLAITREALDRIGGFASVRNEIVDDMALCRRAKRAGLRVLFADGHQIATTRMYRSAREVWEGFSKNLYEGIGARPLALVGVIALYNVPFVLPYVLLLAAALGASALWGPALLGVGANLALRSLLAIRHRQPLEGVVLHPLAVLALVAVAINSWLWTRSGTIRWRGRTYAPRIVRGSG
jgi:cellulose synthase/poly-beta-1,6-N-acetylglucosamine synthase-like glycosyltransferase